MTQQLYINGELLDMEEGTKVTLNYKSNIFGAIDKIVASNSQTIKVPKTVRNRRILDNPTAPAYSSSFRYKRHKVSYCQNGIELVNGYAVLLDSGEDYELAMYWGFMSQFQKWVDEDPTLNDLEGPDLLWNQGDEVAGFGQFIDQGYGFAYYDNGITKINAEGVLTDTDKTNIFPSVTVYWLLQRIQETNGITFVFPDRFLDIFKRTAVPCVDRKAGEEAWEDGRYRGDVMLLNATTFAHLLTPMYAISQSGTVYDRSGLFAGNITYPIYEQSFDEQGNIVVSQISEYSYSVFDVSSYEWFRLRFHDESSGRFTESSRLLVHLCTGANRVLKTLEFPATQNNIGSYIFDVDEQIEVQDFERFYLEAVLSPDNGSGFTLWGALEIVVPFEELEYGKDDKYNVALNLPDISQIDFLQAVCEMYGLYAMTDPEEAATIRFVTLDDLMLAKQSAADWSAKLIDTNHGEPSEVQFSFGDYAQRNIFRYKEDDDVTATGEGVIVLENETLEPEEEIVELPFSATDGNKIIQWELDDEGVEVSFVNAYPRIMTVTAGPAEEALLSFRGMGFDNLLPAYYSRLIDLLRNCIAIKCKLRLNEADLKMLDFERPVYLSQFGRNYAIRSIQSEGATSTAELIQLPLATKEVFIDVKLAFAQLINKQYFIQSTASTSVASDIAVVAEYSVSGEKRQVTVTIPAGSTSSNIANIEGEAYNASIVSITPAYDDIYIYKPATYEVIQIQPIIDIAGSSILFRASQAVGVDITINWLYEDVGDESVPRTSVITAGGTQTTPEPITRAFAGFTPQSVTPSKSGKYSYILLTNIIAE